MPNTIIQPWCKNIIYGTSDLQEYAIFIKFIVLYMSFNSYTYKTYKGADRVQIKKFCNEPKHISIYNDLSENNDFNSLFTYINSSDRKENKGKIISLKDSSVREFNNYNKTLNDYMCAIYQVRCNLFHGGKNFDVEAEKLIVQHAYNSFKIFVEKLESQPNTLG